MLENVLQDDENEYLIAAFEKPESAISDDGQWILWRVSKVWVGQHGRRGRSDPEGGLTLEPPSGKELILAVPLSPILPDEKPANTLTLPEFVDGVLKPLARAVEQGLIDSTRDND